MTRDEWLDGVWRLITRWVDVPYEESVYVLVIKNRERDRERHLNVFSLDCCM
jgi:hypothetical protein